MYIIYVPKLHNLFYISYVKIVLGQVVCIRYVPKSHNQSSISFVSKVCICLKVKLEKQRILEMEKIQKGKLAGHRRAAAN